MLLERLLKPYSRLFALFCIVSLSVLSNGCSDSEDKSSSGPIDSDVLADVVAPSTDVLSADVEPPDVVAPPDQEAEDKDIGEDTGAPDVPPVEGDAGIPDSQDSVDSLQEDSFGDDSVDDVAEEEDVVEAVSVHVAGRRDR